jgi:tetratricopeptide (TPR) repeat protein
LFENLREIVTLDKLPSIIAEVRLENIASLATSSPAIDKNLAGCIINYRVSALISTSESKSMLEQQDSENEIVNTGDILLSAKTKYKQGDYQGAIAEYTLAIQFAPNIALAFSCRGDAYYKLGQEEKAMADYNQAIAINPTLALAYYRRGNLYYSAKKYDLAVVEYNLAIERRPDFALAYVNRGCAHRELYGDREGVKDWQLAAQLFQEQGNLEQHKYVMDLIDLNMSIDTLSGMLF